MAQSNMSQENSHEEAENKLRSVAVHQSEEHSRCENGKPLIRSGKDPEKHTAHEQLLGHRGDDALIDQEDHVSERRFADAGGVNIPGHAVSGKYIINDRVGVHGYQPYKNADNAILNSLSEAESSRPEQTVYINAGHFYADKGRENIAERDRHNSYRCQDRSAPCIAVEYLCADVWIERGKKLSCQLVKNKGKPEKENKPQDEA